MWSKLYFITGPLIIVFRFVFFFESFYTVYCSVPCILFLVLKFRLRFIGGYHLCFLPWINWLRHWYLDNPNPFCTLLFVSFGLEYFLYTIDFWIWLFIFYLIIMLLMRRMFIETSVQHIVICNKYIRSQSCMSKTKQNKHKQQKQNKTKQNKTKKNKTK